MYGALQGSCLGPLIYTDDLPLPLKSSKVNIPADDTAISFFSDFIHTINNAVNEDLMLLKTTDICDR